MAKMKVRARAVDMLGRQQIAGIPTALHELLKNAHDAYAENVRVDFFRDRNVLILRDDGLGMTRDDYENRWLTLGTESKLKANEQTNEVWTGPKNLRRRAILGEKGIGRLAIAAIGPQVLVVTRALRKDGPKKTVMGFVNWAVFEQPGLDVDEVDVPVIEITEDIPSSNDIKAVIASFQKSLSNLKAKINKVEFERILKLASSFETDVLEVLKDIEGPTISSSIGGTYFFVQPTSEELRLDLELAESLDQVSSIQKYLLGFSNTMRDNAVSAPLKAEFWDHTVADTKELIGPLSFFTPEEFDAADHHIEGKFDDTGVFHGKIRIYDEVEHDYTLSPPVEFTAATSCGPFGISIAYVQGLLSESRMEEEEWRNITDKMNSIGGVYVYRDGVRILPYGNSNYDWLSIEHRRTLSAQDWFFSYRRMVGGVEVSAQKNANLREKAGREGFRENLAYRQLRSLIENLLKQIAIDYFRGKSAKISTDHYQLREARQKEAAILKKREKSLKAKRTVFKQSVKQVAEDFNENVFHDIASQITGKFQQGIRTAAQIKNPQQAGKHALEQEVETRQQLSALKEKISILKPRGFKPSKKDQKAFARLEHLKKEFISSVIQPTEELVSESISDLIEQGEIEFTASDRILAPVHKEADESSSSANRMRNQIRKALESLQDRAKISVNKQILDLRNQVESIKIDTNETVNNHSDEETLVKIRDSALSRIENHTRETLTILNDMFAQVESLDLSGDVDTSHLSVVEALEGQNIELNEKLEKFSEWAQVGMALGVVQHEFSGHSRSLYNALKKLKPWAVKNEKLTEVFNDLVTSFQHLESYLQLFLPLDRRMQRSAIEISGESIKEFLEAIFDGQFDEKKIKLIATPAFCRHTIKSYPASIYPVFVNIVDNAIYWIVKAKAKERKIILDIDGDQIKIANTGPGIEQVDHEEIFNFGYSTKQGGTGLGLAISKDVLNRIGFDISLEKAGAKNSPTFLIFKSE